MAVFNRRRHRPRSYEDFFNGKTSFIPRYTSPPDKNTTEWLKAFEENPRLTVVDRIATDLSFMSGKLYRIDEVGEEHEIIRHLFLDFMKNPNPLYEMTSSAIWRLQQIYLDLKGEGYFVIERDLLGRPAELWPLPINWVMMVPYEGHPSYTIRLPGGGIEDIPVDDMFIMKSLSPLDPYKRGTGKAESFADEVEIDEYAAKFQKKFFYNDATPSVVFSMPNSTEDQRKSFIANWKEKLQGVINSHKVAAVNGDVVINKLSESMKDMDMVEGRRFLRDAALEHFNMPREIMGITESSNRAVSEAALFTYAQYVLTPRKDMREDAINKQLLPAFGEDLIWRFDEIIPRNQEFDKAVAMEGWNSGLLTRDQALELLGMPPDQVNGNVYKTTFSDIFIPADTDVTESTFDIAELQFGDTGEEDPELKEIHTRFNKQLKQAKSIKDRRRLGIQRGLALARLEQERQMENVVQSYFSGQAKRIADALYGTQKANDSIWAPIEDIEAANVEEARVKADQFVNSILDWNKESDELFKTLTPYWQSSYQEGAKQAQQAYGLNAIDRPELYTISKLQADTRIKNIQDTTMDSIRKIVSNGIRVGDSCQTVTKAILNEANISVGRAKTIAKTEVHTSLMTGNLDMMQKGGIATKKWVTTGAKDMRPWHAKMNGETVPIKEPFSNGLMHPGDPACNDAKEVVNCKCDMVAGDI